MYEMLVFGDLQDQVPFQGVLLRACELSFAVHLFVGTLAHHVCFMRTYI